MLRQVSRELPWAILREEPKDNPGRHSPVHQHDATLEAISLLLCCVE